MKNKTIGTLLLFALLSMGVKAAPVNLETAQKTASRFYGIQAKMTQTKSLPAFNCIYPGKQKSNDFVPYYIFNVGEQQGFVIVAGDDNAAEQVLAYSLKGQFVMENMPCNVRYWLGFYEEGVKRAAASNTKGIAKLKEPAAGVVKQPLLGDINYNQDVPYNDLCPMDASTGKRSMTGCVATALSMVARYYTYPLKGQGAITYSDKGTTRSMDFSQNTYDWDNILNDYNNTNMSIYTSAQRTAVATIMRDMGHAVQMMYASSQSGAYRPPSSIGMVDYMGFDSILNYRERDDYDNDDEWIALLKENINNDMPVYYTGQGDGGGHAFIFDGYDSADFFHVNWGWGAYCNGWFHIRNLDPESIEGIGAGTGGGYTQMQAIFHNFVPKGHEKRSKDLYLLVADDQIESRLMEDSLYSIAENPLQINFTGFKNRALSRFDGTVALAAYQDGEFLKIVSSEEALQIARQNNVNKSFTLTARLDDLQNGEYEIWAVCKTKDENAEWQKVYGRKGTRYTNDSYIPLSIREGKFKMLRTTAVLSIKVNTVETRNISGALYRQGEKLANLQFVPNARQKHTLRPGAYEFRFWTRGYDTSYLRIKLTHDTAVEVGMKEIYQKPYMRGVRVDGNTATMMWKKEATGAPTSYATGFVVYLDSVEVDRVGSTVTEYVFKNVPKGRHIAGLSSIYKTGLSDMVTYAFTIKTDIANEPTWQGKCNISPNPSANGYFTIEVDRDCRLQASSLNGKLLFEKELSAGSNQVNMSGYAAGTYIFRLVRNNGESTVLKAVLK